MLKQSLIVLIVLVGLAYLSLNIYALLFSDRLIYPVPPINYTESEHTFALHSSDGERIVATHSAVDGANKTLLYLHGNGTDLGHLASLLTAYRDNGISYLAIDYPGYGHSSGIPSEEGCYAAAQAAYDYLINSAQVAPESIILYGRSLGGGPATWLAANNTVGGLILDGTFTSIFRVVTSRRVLPFDRFDNLSRLPQVDCPVLVIHGTIDDTVPFSHAEQNFAAVQSPKAKLWIEGGNHNDLIGIAGNRYWSTVLPFIKNPNSIAQ
ncbi:alpha/beta hydrolase [Coraliomargarita akajimensis]|uniref:AB hydrolase-1 domain-containing protein n=1 Tax=Coraliomargarita akajimensis (strain DSM 45221 / IAM 15411 / JCM 23193 / KCTC 12865 / 04OKA010-24) TaxID=583355 RepID=D5EPG4_CORAD|nr:alpha/beta hydrolase [Coraliomargarita akajimensis]ADE53701.1 conserved hypothetical protein [Coraliomargarita akajimensis DSM 45221]